MMLNYTYLAASILIGGILGLFAPFLIQIAVARFFGGKISWDYSYSFRPLEIEFQNVQEMRDWQIRLTGMSKVLFLTPFFIFSLIWFPHQSIFRYAILATLITGTATLTWTDLLALENPRKWSLEVTKMYSRYERSGNILPDMLPSIRDRPATYLSSLILLGIFVALILEYKGILDYVSNSDSPPYEINTIAQVFGGVGSVIFSIVLVILYDKQASISDTQSEIQKEQKELMRREREPRLSGPYNFKFWGSNPSDQSNQDTSAEIDTRSKEREPNPNSIQFFQTNAGEGLAQNFKLEVVLNVEEGPHNGRGSVCAVQRMDRFPLHKFGESDIQGGEKDVEFMTEELKICFTEPDPGEHISFDTHPFEEGINVLTDEGTSEISLILTLTWEDEFGKEHNEQVYHATSEIEHGMDLVDFIR